VRRQFVSHGLNAWSVRVEVGTIYGKKGCHVNVGSVFPPTKEEIREAMRRCVRALRIVYEAPPKKK
jgi:hypothetical protein